MRQVILTFDDDVYERLSQACDLSSSDLQSEVSKALAIIAYRTRDISLAKAAEAAGISLWEMIDLVQSIGLPVYEYDEASREAAKADTLPGASP